MTKIAVIGASSGCGLETVKAALTRGWQVNAMARNPEKAELKDNRLAWYKGDARNELLLEQVIRGCEAVAVTLAAPIGREKVTLFSESINVILTVMNRLGVKRLVFLSGMGAGDSRGRTGFIHEKILFPLLLARNYADKDRAESLIMKSHKDWTILRPGILTNRLKKKSVRALTKPEDFRPGRISRAEVGNYICECIHNNLNLRETPILIT